MKEHNILVLGMGKSGLAVASLMERRGLSVDLYDEKARSEADSSILGMERKNLHLIFSDDSFDFGDKDYEYCVISPGIPLDRPFVEKVKSLGIELLGEMELSARYFPGLYVAVTGTNGKSTTTSLVHHILKSAGKNSLLAGNIGEPLSSLVEESTEDMIGVLEVSSYQLETANLFHPNVAAITNITEDHLARHKTMSEYISLKKRIFMNQNEEDYVVLNYDDDILRGMAAETKATVLFFSTKAQVDGAYMTEDRLYLRRGEKIVNVMSREDLRLPGRHNVENALCAICVCYALGLETQEIADGIRSFCGVEHRQEVVCELDGVLYVNDSKATNSDSTIMALNSYEAKIHILLGGSPKKADYSLLARTIARKGANPILFGQTKDEIAAALEAVGMPDYSLVDTLREAVELARKNAEEGDIVLLSPACPSFDFFRNFEHRGEVFKEIIYEFEKEKFQ
jgi:UDP-N-acetylmuramoylalanine--D-glutamate ligase